MNSEKSSADELSFSLVRGTPWFHLQRAVGLIPSTGLGVPRRIVLFVLIVWLPMVIWAVWWRRAFPGEVAEPLLQHFGVHMRCLVAIPLLIGADIAGDLVPQRLIPYFVTSGLVPETARAQFVHILRSAERLRDFWLAWVGMLVVTAALVVEGYEDSSHLHELIWATTDSTGTPSLGFGGAWFLFVVRPIFAFLLLVWFWRLVVCAVLLWRISRLDLKLVPTHPDRAGGLGFLENIPFIFSPVVFATSAVIASRWGHEVLYHGVKEESLRVPLALFVATMLVLFLFPLVAFTRQLNRFRRRSLLDYGALVGLHGRLVRRRWIMGESVPEATVLDAQELGPVIDTVAMYEVVASMHPTPIGKQSLISIALPALVPMIPVWAVEVPMKEVFFKLLKALF